MANSVSWSDVKKELGFSKQELNTKAFKADIVRFMMIHPEMFDADTIEKVMGVFDNPVFFDFLTTTLRKMSAEKKDALV